jgi:hypothetical protein
MYGVTGKIPFIPESRSRRKTFRRKSYRRENNETWFYSQIGQNGPDVRSNDGGQTWFGLNGADIRSIDGGKTWFGQRGGSRTDADGANWWDNAVVLPKYQGIFNNRAGDAGYGGIVTEFGAGGFGGAGDAGYGGIVTEFGAGGFGGASDAGYGTLVDKWRGDAYGGDVLEGGYGRATEYLPPYGEIEDTLKRTQIVGPGGVAGRMAAQQLKSGCSECYRTIREFAQGVGEEMYPSDFVSYTDM